MTIDKPPLFDYKKYFFSRLIKVDETAGILHPFRNYFLVAQVMAVFQIMK